MREQHLRAAQLWLAEGHHAIRLKDTHTEELFCVLSPEWEAHFKAAAAKEAASFALLEEELDAIMGRAKTIKRILAEGPRALNRRYGCLMNNPPQGVFGFRGSLQLLPSSGHTIVLGPTGEPIWETLRKATGEELIEAKRQEEAMRQLSMFPDAPAAQPADAPTTPPAPAEPASATDSGEIPF